jgi:hypothetical protein
MKLEQIEKKNIFEVPDGYFDELPMAIQQRVTSKEKAFAFPLFAVSLKYALPVFAVAIASVFIYQNYSRSSTSDAALKDVSTETLVAYLSESDITEDEILQSIYHNQIDFNSTLTKTIETIKIEDTTTLEKLSKDFENEYF